MEGTKAIVFVGEGLNSSEHKAFRVTYIKTPEWVKGFRKWMTGGMGGSAPTFSEIFTLPPYIFIKVIIYILLPTQKPLQMEFRCRYPCTAVQGLFRVKVDSGRGRLKSQASGWDWARKTRVQWGQEEAVFDKVGHVRYFRNCSPALLLCYFLKHQMRNYPPYGSVGGLIILTSSMLHSLCSPSFPQLP